MTEEETRPGGDGDSPGSGWSTPEGNPDTGMRPSAPGAALEALLFAMGEAVPESTLGAWLEIDPAALKVEIGALNRLFADGGRPLRIRTVAGGYQLVLEAGAAAWVRPHLAERQQRLSPALLETLAIVAYRQPIPGAAVDALRGVRAERALAVLEDRGLIRRRGKDGYVTTLRFLTAFGLASLDDLPAWAGAAESGPGPEPVPDGTEAGSWEEDVDGRPG